jgi:hypothetical protein
MDVAAGRSLALGILIAGSFALGSWACGSATGLNEEGSGTGSGAPQPDGESPDSPRPPPDDVIEPPDGCGGCIDVITFDSPDVIEPFDVSPPPFDAPDVIEPFDVSPPPFDAPDGIEPFDVLPPPFDGPQDTGPPWDGGTPVVVASEEQPANLALDDTYVYWENNGGSAVDCPLAGCPGNTPTLLSVGDVGFEYYQTLAVGGGLAYFIDINENIVDCSGGGCSNTPTTYSSSTEDDASFGFGYEQLVTDSANVYFTDESNIYQCPLASSCSSPATIVTSTNAYLGPLSVSPTEVFYADDGSSTQFIRAVPIGGGKSRRVCTSSLIEAVQTMVWTPSYVYFTTGDDPTSIYQCASAGGTSPTVYVSDDYPYGLAADGANLYWTNAISPGNVATCPLGFTCSGSKTIATNQDTPLAIAVNATDVYWTTTNDVYRATKP